MQPYVSKVNLVPMAKCMAKSILDKKQEADTLIVNVRTTYEQLKESYSENQGYSFNLDDVKKLLQKLNAEELNCQEDFNYYHEALSEIYIKFHTPGTTRFFQELYYHLGHGIYAEMRERLDRYLKFLQEAQDPNVYFENQKQQQQEKTSEKEKPSGFVATKLNSKSKKCTLGDGSSLPPIGTQEYNEKPRHRIVKSFMRML